MEGCCLICLKICELSATSFSNEETNSSVSKEKKDYFQRFLKLLERHLLKNADVRIAAKKNYGRGKGSSSSTKRISESIKSFDKLINSDGMSTCDDCFKLTKAFCQLFHDIKTIELLLHWKLWTLKNIMVDAVKVPSRVEQFKEALNSLNLPETDTGKDLLHLRKEIVIRCSDMIWFSPPKISLRKCNSENIHVNQDSGIVIKESVPRYPTNKSRHNNKAENSNSYTKGKYSKRLISNEIQNSKHFLCKRLLQKNDKRKPIGTPNKLVETKSPRSIHSLTNSKLKIVDDKVESQSNEVKEEVLQKNDTTSHYAPEKEFCVDDNNDNMHSPFQSSLSPLPISDTDNYPITGEVEDVSKDNHERSPSPPPQSSASPQLSPLFTSTKAESMEASSSPPVRQLRKIHRCVPCSKTFSSEKNLLLHQEKIKCDDNQNQNIKDEDDASDSELDENHTDYESDNNASIDGNSDGNEDEESTLSTTTGTSDTESDTEDGSSSHSATDEIENESKETKKSKLSRRKHKAKKCYKSKKRFLCPDCNLDSFSYINDLLLHRTRSCTAAAASNNASTSDSIKKESTATATIKEFLTVKLITTKSSKSSAVVEGSNEIAKIKVPLELFICPVSNCPKSFYSAEQLQSHSKLHGHFQCSYKSCKKVKSYAPDLALHEFDHFKRYQKKEDYWWPCPKNSCEYKSSVENLYIRHYLSAHMSLCVTSVTIFCGVCHVTCHSPHQLRKHYLKCHDLNMNTSGDLICCPIEHCFGYFLQQNQLTIHLRRVHDYQLKEICEVKCKDCGKKFNESNDLKVHRLIHHVEADNIIHCSIPKCERLFETKEEMENHIKTQHKDNSMFNCTKCERWFATPRQFKVHVSMYRRWDQGIVAKHMRRRKTKAFKCKDCLMTFKAGSSYTRHRAIMHKTHRKVLFKCSECGVSCKNKRQLRSHEFNMHEEKTIHYFLCSDCKTECFLHLHDLLLHKKQSCDCAATENSSADLINVILISVTASAKRFPPACFSVSLSSNSFKEVATLKCPSDVYFCPVSGCSKPFYSKELLESHSKLHGSFNCGFCEVQKDYAPDLAVHEMMEHSQKWSRKDDSFKFNCPHCAFQFHRKHDCIQHNLEVHKSLSYTVTENSCVICKGVYSHRENLPKHYLQFHNLGNNGSNEVPEVIKCNIENCTGYFLRQSQLSVHLKRVHLYHPQAEDKLKKALGLRCKDCGKHFLVKSRLIFHRLSSYVEKDKIIHCKIPKCLRIFETEEEMEKHVNLFHQQNNKMFNCTKCDRSFATEVALKLHHHYCHTKKENSLQVKAKETFVCDQCGKHFKQKIQLQTHQLSHSGPGSWEWMCSVCSKKCISKQKLEEHQRTHSKEKPFVCEVCGVKYAHRHNLRIHVNSKHGDVMQDIAKKYDRTHFTSRKGVKRKCKRSETKSRTSDSDSE